MRLMASPKVQLIIDRLIQLGTNSRRQVVITYRHDYVGIAQDIPYMIGVASCRYASQPRFASPESASRLFVDF